MASAQGWVSLTVNIFALVKTSYAAMGLALIGPISFAQDSSLAYGREYVEVTIAVCDGLLFWGFGTEAVRQRGLLDPTIDKVSPGGSATKQRYSP